MNKNNNLNILANYNIIKITKLHFFGTLGTFLAGLGINTSKNNRLKTLVTVNMLHSQIALFWHTWHFFGTLGTFLAHLTQGKPTILENDYIYKNE